MLSTLKHRNSLLSVALIVLLLVPCQLKSDIKEFLGIAHTVETNVGKDNSRICIYTANQQKSEVQKKYQQKRRIKLLDLNAIKHISFSENVTTTSLSSRDDAGRVGRPTPLFIHFRKLII